MYNIILMIVGMLICFVSLLIVDKFFKKEGLIVWISVASVLANILVCKTVELACFASSLGNIMFASNFLAVDIINEKYGAEHSKKAVIIGLVSVIGFIIATQFSLLFTPDASDIVDGSMHTLFTFSLRTSVASVVMYFLSNMLNIHLYEKLKKMIPGKLWLRNNVSTIITNCSENYFFAFGAFFGILDIGTIISIATLGTVIETIIAFCDTPFLYLATGKYKKFFNRFKKESV